MHTITEPKKIPAPVALRPPSGGGRPDLPSRRRRRPHLPQPPSSSCYFVWLLALAAAATVQSLEVRNALAFAGRSSARRARARASVSSPSPSNPQLLHPMACRRTSSSPSPRNRPTLTRMGNRPMSSSLFSSSQSDELESCESNGSAEGRSDPSSALAAPADMSQEMLDRTRRQLEAMMKGRPGAGASSGGRGGGGGESGPFQAELDELRRSYVAQPAHSLQVECRKRGLLPKGRKPDLAERLARNDLYVKHGWSSVEASAASTGDQSLSSSRLEDLIELEDVVETSSRTSSSSSGVVLTRFGSLDLSPAAAVRLSSAGFAGPTPIQEAALPVLAQHRSSNSAILHSETGSGKTLAYLLPFTERLWKKPNDESGPPGLAFVLTPTRELAVQVAKVAASLCPPGTVRLVSHPTHLLRPERDNEDSASSASTTRMYVGSATCVAKSLFGSPELPAPPTPKPLAIQLLQNCRYVVLDEVDRLLLGSGGGAGSGGSKSKRSKRRKERDGSEPSFSEAATAPRHVHEKPAAIVAAAIMRHSLGKAQVVAASATVGRPLRRELARVMGLTPEECPPVVRGGVGSSDSSSSNAAISASSEASTRAVTIPESVQHYVYEVKGSEAAPSVTSGALLAAAYQVIQRLPAASKTLVVLTRGFGISTQNAVGALSHFGCHPKPQSLMDSLQTINERLPPPFPTTTSRENEFEDDSNDVKREVQPLPLQDNAETLSSSDADGYLLVTGEDAVRGLDMDGLDVVLVVGRPNGVDEYTHIAGRTGRAGRPGVSLSVVESAAPFLSWQTMLRCQFRVLSTPDDVLRILAS